MRSARKDLLEGNILLNIIKFSIPMALMSLLQVLYNTADRVIVGRLLGAGELAAVGADGTIIGIVVALTVGFGSGASILFGKMVGAKDLSHMKKFVQSSIKVVAVLGILCSVAGIIIAPMLLKWINTDPSIIDMATEYLQYYLVGLTFTLLYGVAGGLLRSCGDNKSPTIAGVVGGLVNVLLSLLFVSTFGMGVKGVAIGTVLGQFVQSVILLVCLMRTDRECVLRLDGFWQGGGEDTVSIIKKGLPIGLQTSLLQISSVYILSKFVMLSDPVNALAGWTAQSQVDNVFFCANSALVSTILIFTSQAVGAGREDLKRQIAVKGVLASCVFVLSLSVVATCLAKPLIGLFNGDSTVIEYGERVIYVIVPFYVTFALSESVGAVIKGSGDTLTPFIFSLFSILLSRILLIEIFLPMWTEIEMIGITYPISWGLNALCGLTYILVKKVKSAKNENIKKI